MQGLSTWLRVGLRGVAPIGCVCVVACSEAGWNDDELELGSTQQPMSVMGESPELLWHTQSNNVHVCFLDGASSYRSTFQSVITETWEASSGLKFFWEGSCPAAPPQQWVTVHFPETGPGEWGGWAAKGVGARRPDCFPAPDSGEFQVCVKHTPNDYMFKEAMVHEMGHALGIEHEHERVDETQNPGPGCDTNPESSFPLLLTPFDTQSIMRYCRDFDNNGAIDANEGHDLYALSDLDKLGAAQAYARPGVHIVSSAMDGTLLHTLRQYAGVWPFPFGDVEAQAGNMGTVRDVAVEHTSKGQLWLLGANSLGQIKLTSRARDGAWDSFSNPFNDIMGQAGNPGFVTRVGLGEIGDVPHALVTTSDGHLKLSVRGIYTWGAWEDVEVKAGNIGTPVKAAATGIGTRLQICAVTSDGHIWATYRRASDGWYKPWIDLETIAGERGTFVDVDCTNVGDRLHVVGVTSTGGLYHTVRFGGSTDWTSFGDVKALASNPGSVVRVATAQIMGELHVAVRVGTTLYYTVRWAPQDFNNLNPAWDPFVNVNTAVGQTITANSIALD